MKEIVNVNIGSVAFNIDKDAYRILRRYFDDIRRRLPDDDTETMSDIESRVAELFSEKITSSMRVVTLEMVRTAIALMGQPSDFGECKSDADTDTNNDEPSEPHQLRRSLTNRSIAGVCGGIAEFFDADPTLIRLVTLLLILFGGLSIWVYVILWIVIPEQPIQRFDIHKNKK